MCGRGRVGGRALVRHGSPSPPLDVGGGCRATRAAQTGALGSGSRLGRVTIGVGGYLHGLAARCAPDAPPPQSPDRRSRGCRWRLMESARHVGRSRASWPGGRARACTRPAEGATPPACSRGGGPRGVQVQISARQCARGRSRQGEGQAQGAAATAAPILWAWFLVLGQACLRHTSRGAVKRRSGPCPVGAARSIGPPS